MSEETILRELREMEGRLSEKISETKTATAVVGQQVKDHIEWEQQKYKDLGEEVKCIRGKVNNLRVDNAVTKAKVGGIGAIGGAIVLGLTEGLKRIFGG